MPRSRRLLLLALPAVLLAGPLPPAERSAFRGWFAFLAESIYFLPAASRPGEINDCAALVRYAYRESLRVHDAAWAARVPLPAAPRLPAFPPQAVDPRFRLGDGSLGHFADAKTLRQFNTHRVSGDIGRAIPGDLLFYHQPDQRLPDHVMVFAGPSHFAPDREIVIYHTGSDEVRRLTLAELRKHSEPRWRPTLANPAFRGVFRWNLAP